MQRTLGLFFAMVFFLGNFSFASADGLSEEDVILEKLTRLENEQAEILAALETEKSRLKGGDSLCNNHPKNVTTYATRDDLEAELAKNKGWAWKKDAFKITPYGYFSLVGAWETNRTVPGEYPLYVQPRVGDDVQSGAYFDMKSTRLGLMITAPEMNGFPGVQVGGVFELDFQGAFSVENKSGVLFRKGYLEMKNEHFLFLVGQTWDVYSPLFPNMQTYVPGIGCGNLGYRRPMVRYDRYRDTGNGRWELQGAIAASLTGNLSAFSGETWEGRMASYPEIQARMGRTFKCFGPWQREASFGVSAFFAEKHYQNPTDDFTRFSWSVNFDMMLRFTDKIYLSGEFYFGELLNSSFGGVLQDINPYTLEDVGATGGWVSLTNDFADRWHSVIGFCVDDPWNRRLTGGRMRSWNSCTFANISYDMTKKWSVGAEYTFWATTYTDIGTAYSHHFQLQLKYSI